MQVAELKKRAKDFILECLRWLPLWMNWMRSSSARGVIAAKHSNADSCIDALRD
jgi:hypothetical protein